jgi:hypothetical protein
VKSNTFQLAEVDGRSFGVAGGVGIGHDRDDRHGLGLGDDPTSTAP